MGASLPQVTEAGPVHAQANDLTQVRRDPQTAVSSATQPAQQSSYVPPHPNIQATQTFFDPAPAPATAGPPAPVAQGYSVGSINTTQPLYCPAEQVIWTMLQPGTSCRTCGYMLLCVSTSAGCLQRLQMTRCVGHAGVSSISWCNSGTLSNLVTLWCLQLPRHVSCQASTCLYRPILHAHALASCCVSQICAGSHISSLSSCGTGECVLHNMHHGWRCSH